MSDREVGPGTDGGAAAFLPSRIAREKGSLDALSDARGGIMTAVLLDAAGRRRSPATLPHFDAGRPPRNKGIRYPQTHRRPRKSSPSCAPPATPAWPSVARADRRALARRPAHPRGARADRGRPGPAPRVAAGAPRQGRPPPRSRHGRLGVGATRAVAQDARRAAHRTAVLRGQRSDPWTAMVCLGGALGPAACGAPGRCAAAVCAAPSAACPCR
jgi:hypothetical protein